MRVVRLVWIDSLCHQGSWVTTDELVPDLDEMRHESIGFLVTETEDALVLALSRGVRGCNYAGVMTIPRRAVIEQHEVAVGCADGPGPGT